jgi:hypothetical protein
MKRLVAGAVIAVAALGGAGAFDDNTFRDDTGAIIEGGGLGAYAIQVGDCVNEPDNLTLVESLEAVPCSQAHDAEAYADFQLTGSSWPGEDAVSEDAWTGCYERYESFVGIPWDDSELDFWVLQPTEESWADDDRAVTCALATMDGSPLRGSMRGSNR